MDIIFHGSHDIEEANGTIAEVLRLFQERYQVGKFREMHLILTLVDDNGNDVELVDSETKEPYRMFEVYKKEPEFIGRKGKPYLRLVSSR